MISEPVATSPLVGSLEPGTSALSATSEPANAPPRAKRPRVSYSTPTRGPGSSRQILFAPQTPGSTPGVTVSIMCL